MQITISRQPDFYLEATALISRMLNSGKADSDDADIFGSFEAAEQNFADMYVHSEAGAAAMKEMQGTLLRLKAIAEDVFAKLTCPREKLDFYFGRSFSSESYSLAFLLWNVWRCEQEPLRLSPETRHKRLAAIIVDAVDNEIHSDTLPADEAALIGYLDQSAGKPEDCWQLLRFYRNMEAYYADVKQIWDETVSLLEPWKAELLEMLRPRAEALEREIQANPSCLEHRYPFHIQSEALEVTFSAMSFASLSYRVLDEDVRADHLRIGILVDATLLVRNGGEASGKKLLRGLKCLSDGTRLEILHLLKESSLCGQELGQRLSLTPATISHHMNSLCNQGFVYIARDGSRINYHLNQKALSDAIEELRSYLL